MSSPDDDAYPVISVAADAVVFAVRPETGLSVLLVRRRFAPYRGRWAFPGGFVEEREDLEHAARRELREETGVSVLGPVHQLAAYGAPGRDRRRRVVSVAYAALAGPALEAEAADDASEADWRPVHPILTAGGLAFDHDRILLDAYEWLCRRLERTSDAMALLDGDFTVAELRGVYEAVWGRWLDPGNFQRKVGSIHGLLEETGELTAGGRGRRAALYRPGPVTEIWPPMSRERDR